jgi:hypothetical protein
MKRTLRFALLLLAALALAPFLPIYIERTMLRSWRTDQLGDVIEWGWKICTLNTFWADYPYLTPEEAPAFWLKVNFALALFYALVISAGIDQFLTRRRRRAGTRS